MVFKISRQDLYEKVWSMPVHTLAKEWNVSDWHISKACKKNNVPLPVTGHWSHVKLGRIMGKSPLPNAGTNFEIILPIRTSKTALAKIVKPTFRKIIRKPHYLITQTKNHIIPDPKFRCLVEGISFLGDLHSLRIREVDFLS